MGVFLEKNKEKLLLKRELFHLKIFLVLSPLKQKYTIKLTFIITAFKELKKKTIYKDLSKLLKKKKRTVHKKIFK